LIDWTFGMTAIADCRGFTGRQPHFSEAAVISVDLSIQAFTDAAGTEIRQNEFTPACVSDPQ